MTANFLSSILNLSLCARFSFVIVLTVRNKQNDFQLSQDS